MQHRLLWLHVKKSAGQSTRKSLGPLYIETDRTIRPGCFATTPQAEWNDVLNNYRVPLGDWQFRRTEFARRLLFPDTWDSMLRLAFARHPVSRCVSMFHYLFFQRETRNRLWHRGKLGWIPLSLASRMGALEKVAFDLFLDTLEEQEQVRGKGPNAAPINLHFSTHTNPMSNDVLSDDGRLNLTHLVRLESFEAGIDLVYRELGVERPAATRDIRRNAGPKAAPYSPTPAQLARIQALYARDFDLYEDALTP